VVRVRQKGEGYESKSGEKLMLENNFNMNFGYGGNGLDTGSLAD
jgi:hypothetical protein